MVIYIFHFLLDGIMEGDLLGPTTVMFTTTLSQANCRKVFIQRDFSEGSGVRFATRFPVELEGKMDRQLFDQPQ